jgi:arsenate reductase
MSLLFVCYPRCSTCAKARGWLTEHAIDYTERDIKGDNPTEAELRDWQQQSGLPLKRFFNTSGMAYRDLELKDRLPAMSDDEQFALLASDGMLVKRPILAGDGLVLVGFREQEWAAALL